MILIVALRLFSKSHARLGVESFNKSGMQRGKLLDVGIDRLYPVLKNAAMFLAQEGKLPVTRQGLRLKKDDDGSVEKQQADCQLYWCEIETQLPLEYWQSRHEVEVVLKKATLDEFSAKIRARSGAAYLDACEEFGRSLNIHQYPIEYMAPVNRQLELV